MNKNDLDPTKSPLAAFGVQLRRSREAAGMTQSQLGKEINYSAGFVSYVERAERMPKLKFATCADVVLRTGGTLELMWWQMYHATLIEGFPQFAEHEAVATVIRTFESDVIPGLLQTREYAASQLVFASGRMILFRDYSEASLEFRMARQRALQRTPSPMVHAILDEGCLLRPVGGPVVMANQLLYLEELSRRPNYVIQVAPFSMGERRSLSGPATLLTLPDRSLLGYTETIQRGYLERDPDTLEAWSRMYDLLRGEALSPTDSLSMIRAVRKGLLNVTSNGYANASWLKSSYSGNPNGQCIEIAPSYGPTLPVRDSKDPEGPALAFPTPSFTAFVNGVKAGQFDRP